MEPEPEQPAEAEASQPTDVMDAAAEAPAAPTEAAKPPTTGAVMDVVAPPPAEKTESPTNAEAGTPAPEVAAKPAKPVTPKKPRGNGVTAAIIATVIIVLGLAALATYAFLQSR